MTIEPLFPRRHPCPCGSGKKFKDCHEGSVSIDRRKVFAAEAKDPGSISRMIAALGKSDA